MGEFVSEMQERLLPEYEQMKHYQIFTPEQIRECIRKRERLQLKLTQSGTVISNYLDFILYEKQLHQTVTEKEKWTGVKLSRLKTAIASRIIRLHREVLGKFPHDERLWNSYIKFSKKSVPQEVAGIYEKMLSYHGDKPQVWVDAALWLYEYNRQNIPQVRDILLRGLQRHPTAELLNKCLFDILLKEAAQTDNKLTLNDNTVSEQDIVMERVEAVYRNSMGSITQIDYFLNLLESCEEFKEITAKLQRMIIDDMQEKFPREPALWDALAQRELRGLSLTDLCNMEKTQRDHEQNKPQNSNSSGDDAATNTEGNDSDSDTPIKSDTQSSTSIWQPRTQKRRIELCVQVYKTAVQELQTQEMWCLYIDAMLALNKDTSTSRNLKQQCLAVALQQGHRSRLMHVRHYRTLRDMLACNQQGGGELAAVLLSEALEHAPTLYMHELLLSTYIQNDDEPHIYELLNQARKTLGNEMLPIWQRGLLYYRSRDDAAAKQRLEQLYQQACDESGPEFVELRCDYLRYCWIVHSVAKAREVYVRLALQPPMSLQLHRQMAELEAGLIVHEPADIKSWRMCYEYMAIYFGKKDPRIWLDYIAFERDHGEPKTIALLTKRALATLDPELVSIFEAERALTQVGVGVF